MMYTHGQVELYDREAPGAWITDTAMRVLKRASIKMVLFALDAIPRHYTLRLADVIRKRYRSSQRADSVVEVALRCSVSTAAVLNELLELVGSDGLIEAINNLITKRHNSLNAIFESAHEISDPSVRAAVELWKAENNGLVLDGGQLLSYLDTISRFSGQARNRLELLLLHAMIKAERLDLVNKFFKTSKNYSPNTIPTVYKLGILRCVLKTEPQSYPVARHGLARGMTSLDSLKLIEVDIAAGYIKTAPSHNQVVSQFLTAAPKDVSRAFEDLIKPFYDNYDMTFMEARLNPDVGLQILAQIEEALRMRRPLSLIRVGDGEAYACANESTYITLDDAIMRERHWWGGELDPMLRRVLQVRIRYAIESADYVGMPSIYRFIRDTHFSTRNLTATVSMRGLATVMSTIKPKFGAKIIEDRVHQLIFTKRNLDVLIDNAQRRVVIVSSLQPEAVDELFPNAIAITVPTHHKMRTNESFSAGDEALPYMYQEVIKEIEGTVQSGDLVFVGAGIIGKIFVHESYLMGAVALDVGSMLDYLVGAKTRSVADVV